MARKPAPAENKTRRRRTAPRRVAPAGAWRLPPLVWILQAGRPGNAAPAPTRLLSTTLPEAFLLAAGLKGAEVVALEPCGDRAKAARLAATRRRLRNLRVEHATLDQPALGELVGGNFDAILAHETLHAVADADAAWSNLAAAVAPEGSVYTTLRTPAHPTTRLDEAVETFGLEARRVDEASLQVRSFLAALGGFPGPADARPGGDRALLAGPAPLAGWLERASTAGLYPRVSDLTARTLPRALTAGHTGLLGCFALPKLLALLDRFLRPEAVAVVFSREVVAEPPWLEPASLAHWRPMGRFLPLRKLRPLGAPWEASAAVTVEIPGVLARQDFTLSRYLLEVLRRSNGCRSLGDLMAGVPHRARLADLVGGLHFLHHAFIMELLPPAD